MICYKKLNFKYFFDFLKTVRLLDLMRQNDFPFCKAQVCAFKEGYSHIRASLAHP